MTNEQFATLIGVLWQILTGMVLIAFTQLFVAVMVLILVVRG